MRAANARFAVSFVGILLVSNRLMEPWARHLKQTADLTPVQYNVLRILRGQYCGPARSASGRLAAGRM